jgi:DNA-binding NarL/FixJ family response regulator
VLVVDHDAEFRGRGRRILTAGGHVTVGEATGSARRSRALPTRRPDKVLADTGLPDGDGFDPTRQLCAMPLPPRVVPISTNSDAANRPTAQRAGAIGYLPKAELSGAALGPLIEGC